MVRLLDVTGRESPIPRSPAQWCDIMGLGLLCGEEEGGAARVPVARIPSASSRRPTAGGPPPATLAPGCPGAAAEGH